MNKHINQTPSVRFVILAAGTIIIVWAIYAAASFLLPILLALLFTVVFYAPLVKLQRMGMSTGMALGMVLLGVVIIAFFFIGFLAITISGFAEELPAYQENLTIQLAALQEMLRGFGLEPGEIQLFAEDSNIDIGRTLSIVFSAMGQLLSNTFVILFYVIFMLVEATTFQKKIKVAFHDNENAYGYFSRVMSSLQYYLVIKTQINLITGAFVAGTLWLIGLDFALLWGFVAFLLNYIPNFGSIIAAIPAVVLAFIQFGPGWTLLLIIGIYLGVNIFVGYVLEPKMMGQGLGLSALVVLIAVVFWGWVLGPIGLILSVPITVTLKIFMESYDGSRWLAIMLGTEDDLA